MLEREMFFRGGVKVVPLRDRVLLLFNPEEPASYRSKHAFQKTNYAHVEPPKSGYLQGAVGCTEYLEIPRNKQDNRKAAKAT